MNLKSVVYDSFILFLNNNYLEMTFSLQIKSNSYQVFYINRILLIQFQMMLVIERNPYLQ